MQQPLSQTASAFQTSLAWLRRGRRLPIVPDLAQIWVRGIKLVLSLLILTILVALAGGVIKTFLDIRLLFNHAVDVALRQIIVDTLILLAVVEVLKTTVESS